MRPTTDTTTILLPVTVVLVAVAALGVLGPAAIGSLTGGAPPSATDSAVAASEAAAAGGATAPSEDAAASATPTPDPSTTAVGRAVPNLPGLQPDESAESDTPRGPDEADDTQTPPGTDTPGNQPSSDEGNAENAPPAGNGAEAQPAPGENKPAPEAAEGPPTLQTGDAGPAVTELQHRLQDLGYWLGGANGTYDHLTRQAVMAFQGVEGLSRDGVAGPQVQAALEHAQRPTPHAGAGDHLEIDLNQQVLRVVEGGQVAWTLHTSTGSGERYTHPDGGTRIASTPTGEYTIERRIDGWRKSDLGRLYRPAYFVGGIAVHGFTDVPSYPASHGCVRVTMEAIDFLWQEGFVDKGRPVIVH